MKSINFKITAQFTIKRMIVKSKSGDVRICRCRNKFRARVKNKAKIRVRIKFRVKT